jgi:transposase
LFTKNGKSLTAVGVKPICPFQQVFQSLYLFGAVSPINGNSFFLQMPHCNANNFQIFLDEFAAQDPDEFKIIVLDNGAFHKAKSLIIPENILLIFLPPYSPELNPAEKIWAKFKRNFTNRLFKTLDDLDKYVCQLAVSINSKEIISICSFDYIFVNKFWTIV